MKISCDESKLVCLVTNLIYDMNKMIDEIHQFRRSRRILSVHLACVEQVTSD